MTAQIYIYHNKRGQVIPLTKLLDFQKKKNVIEKTNNKSKNQQREKK